MALSPEHHRAPTTGAPMPGLADLFVGFFTVGICGFGGVMPWARRITVDSRHWLSEDEFVDALAMCQFVPGPNIVNFSVGLGSRFHGVAGAVTSVVGLLVAPMVIVICLSLMIERVADHPAVVGALHGMAAVAAALVIAMAVKVATPLTRRRDWLGIGLAVLAFVAVAIFHVPLVPTLLILAPIAVVLHWRLR
jgi:chromate transporter